MNLASLPPLIISILFLLLGCFVYSKNRQNSKSINRIFFLICFSSCIWLFFYSLGYSYDNKEMASLWFKIGFSGVIFIPVSILHYPIEFLRLKKLNSIVLFNYITGICYVAMIWNSSLLIDGVIPYSWGYYPKAGPLHPYFLAHFLGMVGFSFTLWFYSFFFRKETFSNLQIMQVKYVIAAYIIYNFASIDFLPNYGIEIYPFGFLPSFVFCMIIGYTIVRHRLMDINLVFRKSMVYSLSAGILTSLFVVVVITMTKYFSDMAGIKSYTILAITSLLIAVFFNPLRNKIQRLVDKRFYKRSYDYYSTIQQVSSTLTSMFNQNSILKFIGNMIYEVLGLEGVYMIAAVPAEGIYEAVYQMNKDGGRIDPVTKDGNRLDIDEKSPAIKLFTKSRDIIVKDELPLLEEKFGRDFAEEVWKDMEKFKGVVLIPVFVDDNLSFLIVLGWKLSGDMFTDEDINMLSTISDQMAISLKNAQLYSGRVQTERLASIGMMSATFAHEIRNPLTSLKTFAQLMPEKYNDPEFRDSFSKIVEGEIEKIDTLIGDLLDFSSEKKSTRVNNFNIVELVNETVDYIKGKFSHEKESIVVEKMYGEKEIRMSGDAAKLKQAFGIIITNGFQAMNGSGTLSIDIKKNAESIDVAISDTGEGIRHEDISKIFDPFVTTKEMGVGIGLAITKRIIEDHEGKIYVKSRLSEGTTFTISLPVNI